MKTFLIHEPLVESRRSRLLRVFRVPFTSATHTKPARRAGYGFTLLELLIVITMMIFITTIAVMNYFGAMRASGFTAASSDVFNALLMARQRACLDNKSTVFYLLDSTNYVIQQSFGTISGFISNDASAPAGGGVVFYDQYGSGSFSSNSLLINMANGNTTTVWQLECANTSYSYPFITANGTTNYVNLPSYALHVMLTSASGWNVGDPYGADIFSPQQLPKGFVFTQGAGSKIIFKPDGTIDTSGLASPPLTIQETIGTNHVTFTFDASGRLSQGT